MARPLSEFEADDEIGGYVIIRVLSRNCFGSSYLCQHAISGKRVVVKTFPPGIQNDPGFSQRYELLREQLVTLKHTNIHVTRQLAMQNGEPYAVFEYLLGSRDRPPLSLQDLLIQNGHLSENQVYRLTLQLCGALEYAHACKGGVVHCNLKPSNIFFTPNGVPKISEFGLLNLISQNLFRALTNKALSNIERQRKTGVAVPWTNQPVTPAEFVDGDEEMRACQWNDALSETLEYMSPEQKSGHPVTPQSNVYSLGLILYRMLTGRSFAGVNAPTMPSDLGLNAGWDHIVCTATHENPAERYQTIAEFRDAVRHIQQSSGFWLYAVVLAAMVAILMTVASAEFGRVTREIRQNSDAPPPAAIATSRQLSEAGLSAEKLLTAVGIPTRPEPVAPHPWALHNIDMVFAYIPPMPLKRRITLRSSATDTPAYVTIDYPYWIGVTEVTQQQFLAVTAHDPSLFRRADARNPVHRVTWEDAEFFCRTLTHNEQLEGRLPQELVYRLPTEAEWVAAYVAEQTDEQRIRHVLENDVAWHAHNSDGRPHPPGERPNNTRHLFDLEGNLREWCHDWYGEIPNGNFLNYVGPDTGIVHVLRGGSFLTDSRIITPYLRTTPPPIGTDDDIGFRVILAPPIDPVTNRIIRLDYAVER